MKRPPGTPRSGRDFPLRRSVSDIQSLSRYDPTNSLSDIIHSLITSATDVILIIAIRLLLWEGEGTAKGLMSLEWAFPFTFIPAHAELSLCGLPCGYFEGRHALFAGRMQSLHFLTALLRVISLRRSEVTTAGIIIQPEWVAGDGTGQEW